jgi:hypothetical protein
VAREAGIEPTAVDARFFRVLGIVPALGAGFMPDDELSPAVTSGSDRFRRMLLGAQMSVTALLLYLAGLTAHTFVRATTFDFGFDTQNVLLFHQPLPAIGADADLSRFRSNDPVFDARHEESCG